MIKKNEMTSFVNIQVRPGTGCLLKRQYRIYFRLFSMQFAKMVIQSWKVSQDPCHNRGRPVATGAVAQPGISFGTGQPPDVRPTVPSVYFRTVEIDIKHQRKTPASLFRGRRAPSATFWLRYCTGGEIWGK